MVTQSISLNDALDSIAAHYELNADDLIEFAAQDPHGGFHDKYDDGFPAGSVWRVEGQVLYALVRALIDALPDGITFRAVELGTHKGCSATHILQAIADSGNGGTLVCVDLNGAAGNLIPSRLLTFVEFVRGDMFEYLTQQSADMQPRFDFILEDGSHHTEDVERVWRAAYHLLKPGGVIVSHDAEHLHIPSNTGVGAAVREGIARAGYYALVPPVRTYKVAPSDCGFAIYRKPLEPVGQDYVPPEDRRKNDEPADANELAQGANADGQRIPSIEELLKPPDYSAMTIAELKAFAEQRNIPLEGARTKSAIIAAIEAVTG